MASIPYGRGVRKVSERILQDGRTLVYTEEDASKLDFSEIPDGSLKVNKKQGTVEVKLTGQSNWVPANLNNDGTLCIAKDNLISVETFTITSTDCGNNEFRYLNSEGQARRMPKTAEGGYVFELEKGSYQKVRSHLEVTIDDVLHRDAASGGLIELTEKRFELRETLMPDMKITAKYARLVKLGNPMPRVFIGAKKPENAQIGDIWIDTSENAESTSEMSPDERKTLISFGNVVGKPTDLAGYGITDDVAYNGHVHSYKDILDFPVTMPANGGRADYAGQADSAKQAAKADLATLADSAKKADLATEALHAAAAQEAVNAKQAAKADYAVRTDHVDKALNADYSTNSGHAINADKAKNADVATKANTAVNADYATKAHEADKATVADSAAKASRATVAESAKSADTAGLASRALSADSAKKATTCSTADTAVTAISALSCTGNAATASKASTAANAEYAAKAGWAEHAASCTGNAATATNATCADRATNANEAKLAKEADHAKKADNAIDAVTAQEANHAKNADNAKNATNAAYATSAGTASSTPKASRADVATDAEKLKGRTVGLAANQIPYLMSNGKINPNNLCAHRHNYSDINGNVFIRGMIMAWYGNGNPPTGWKICDGQNGTPDLRDRFIVGAGKSYGKGATGGANTVTLTTRELPNKGDGLVGRWTSETGNDTCYNGDSGRYGATGYGFVKVTDIYNSNRRNGGGDHNVSDYEIDFRKYWGGQGHENRPPYYALFYIMYVG